MSRWDPVPAELKAQQRWVCWKLVERDGRRTKMPVCAATGKMASSTDAATWCPFDEAVAACGRLGCDGVGFVFGPDRAYTGLDLDHVLHGGVLDEEYRWVVDAADTYTEVSPSGDGLHLYFRGSKPEGAERCRRGPVEMYDCGRFFTVTGNAYGDAKPVACRPDVVERAYRTWIEPVEEKKQPTLMDAVEVADDGRGAAGDVSDADLVERMCRSRSGSEIRALLDGDLSAHGGDHSAADMALCSHLAFWCAGDEARMDRIFRSSGLMRPKWDARRGGATYGAQTVSRAARNAAEHYRPRRKAASSSAPSSKAFSRDANGCSIDVTGAGDGDAMGEGLRAPSAPGWFVDGRGCLWTADAEGSPRRDVTRNPPWIACDLVDVDTGDVRALVRCVVAGKLVERAVDREAVMSQNRVVATLSRMGANVTTANAKDVVRYLTDCERRLEEPRPRVRSVTHLGWADGPLGAFMPYDAGGAMRFDASPDELPKARPFVEPAGTLEGWVAGVGPARDSSPAFRCVMAASFASPLVALLGVQPFIVYLWGRSRSGKTPTLKAAGSVWGDPTEGADSYYRTFADTPKSIVRAAALLHDVPVIVDELQSKGSSGGGQGGKRMAVEDLLYSLSLGHERSALNSDRTMMRAGSWKSLTIATGEIPIVGDSTQQGAANRTLELNAEPFADVADAQAMHRLVARQHGTAGRAYVECLRRNPKGFYEGEFARVRDAVASVAGGHPQADNVALLAFADALAGFYVFGPGSEWQTCLEGALGLAVWALGHSTGAAGGDTDLKAIQFVSEWVARNRIHFEDSAEADRLERYGVVDASCERPGGLVCVFSSVLERALSDAGFDRAKTLRRMADEGLLALPAGRGMTMQRRVRGARVHCVCVDAAAMEAFLDKAAGGEAPVLPSCGGSPC